MTTTQSPERWARFLEEAAPGLTWLAATLLEWAELPPGARRQWRVMVQESRAGEVSALAALDAGIGLLAVAARPDVPPPFLGESESVQRLVGDPATLAAVIASAPELLLRRAPGWILQAHTYDLEIAVPHPGLRRAPAESWQDLEAFREVSGGLVVDPRESGLLGPTQRGDVWILEEEGSIGAMFRVEGVGRRRVQVADACVHPALRGRGLGTAMLQSIAHVARAEYARGAVVALPDTEAASRAAAAAGYQGAGALEVMPLA